jgi:quinol monooxygenase YgiN
MKNGAKLLEKPERAAGEDIVETIIEVVIFYVKPDRQEEFWEAMKPWVSHVKESAGFVSYNYFRSMSEPGMIIQILEFQYKFSAQHILKKYQEKVGDERFHSFFHLLQRKPVIDYYEKIDFLGGESKEPGKPPSPAEE